ncbi:MAG: efflux RND transporter periplasmic adaptor subunit [Betaproteobacteria bacterium]|nr:efflux RND transporter periplasmic adaptor subunit [Betaproteobacteria bacterium]NBY52809.1 efflux RND transporter periplasmic adaptor subunit [Betaproteobacteria bacterium]NCA24070.1 efflux RND transporter periplasmic adaptor subunit [Betaproteobacteria bacterium]
MMVTASSAVSGLLSVQVVKPEPVQQVFRVAGRVDFDEKRVSRIGTTVPGRVTELNAWLGQDVKTGAKLASLSSADLSAVQLTYLKAHAQTQLLTRSVERARALLAADVIGSAELQRRQNELEVAEAEKRAAADQLRMLGMADASLSKIESSGAISSVKPLLSTQNGTVVERKVSVGQVVQPADILYVIADLSQVRVVAEVPEQEARGLALGQQINIDIPALGERRDARITYVSPTVNPETRTILVRTELENAKRLLKPAMLATVEIAGEAIPRLALPASAVVRENNLDHVFVETTAGTYRLTPVVLGHPGRTARGDELRPVVEGLEAGARVVMDGAFHLNNERKRVAQ